MIGQLLPATANTYRFEGMDTRSGERRSGSIRAASLQAARQKLMTRSIAVTHLEHRTTQRIRNVEMIQFLESLLLLLRSGMELVPALTTIRQQEEGSRRFQNRLEEVCLLVQTGEPFSRALQDSGMVQNPFVLSLIRSGEQTGSLNRSLEAVVYYLNTLDRIKSRVSSAATYPLIVLVVSIVAIVILARYVVPIFAGLYTRYGSSELPWLTVALMNAVAGFRRYGWILGLLCALVVVFAVSFRDHPSMLRLRDRFLRHTPIVRSIYANLQGFQCFRTLEILTESGVELVDALAMQSGMFRSSRLGDQLQSVHAAVLRGDSLYDGLQHADYHNGAVLTMIRSGETAGNLKDSFRLIAHRFQNRFERRVDRIQTIVEPVFIVVISLIVGTILVAMYLPMFDIVNVMR